MLSHVWLFATPWIVACQASLSITNFQSKLKLMSIEFVMPSNHLILCCTLLLLPSVFPSIQVFSNESVLHIRWPNYWSFSISPPMNSHNWFPLGLTALISLLSKGLTTVFSNTTVKSHHFFSTQLSSWSNSHIHTWLTWKTAALTRWTFVGKVRSLLINMLSRLVITFLPMGKCLSISQLQSPYTVILEPKNIKFVTVSIVFSFFFFLPWIDETRYHNLYFLNVEF